MTARFPADDGLAYRVVADEAELTWRWGQRFRPPFGDVFTQLQVVFALLFARRDVDVLVGGRYADLVGVVQALLPVAARPMLLLDNEWMLTPRSPFRRWLVRSVRRLSARGVSKLQVICEAEAEAYSAYFNIPKDKFVWIPYCPPPAELGAERSEGDYIFSGGVHERDWHTFSEALRDLPVELRIAAPMADVPSSLRSSNMTFLGRVSREEYFRQLGGCKLLVLSLAPVVRYPGVITYAYAMRMGKCVVVNDPHGARSYIQDRVTGRVLPNGDALALRQAVQELLDDDALRLAISKRALEFAEQALTPAAYWSRVAAVVEEIASERG